MLCELLQSNMHPVMLQAEAMLIDVSPIHHQDPDDIIRSFNVLLPAGC